MTDNLPTPNIPLLRKAVEWAEAEAAKTDGTCLWVQQSYITETACGTAYCIAGYVAAVSPEVTIPSTWSFPQMGGREVPYHEVGQTLLGLTTDEAYDLFDALNTIYDVRETAEEIAARAGERL